MPQFVHFNSHQHRRNKVDGGKRKALVFRRTKTAPAVRCREIRFANASGRFVYDPDNPLKCGAVAWVEFDDGTVVPVDPERTVDCAGKAKKPRKPAAPARGR